ncbi:MAG: dTDP-4-dehydrorhamnose 3,5-epimerase family protein [Promethearchaeota archaeon]
MTEKIKDVVTRQLKPIMDERGYLMECLRADWDVFEKFGQAYITVCFPGVVKGWHYHKLQDDNFIGLVGNAKVVLFDEREDSPTKGVVNEFFLGEKNPVLLHIPKGVWHGFKAIGGKEAVILNVPTMTYNYEKPDEYRRPFDDPAVPYDWDIKMG